MSESSHPAAHTTAPTEVRGLLIPLRDLDLEPGWVYALFNLGSGWRLTRALDDAILPSAYAHGTRNERRALLVELGADLAEAPAGSATTVRLVES